MGKSTFHVTVLKVPTQLERTQLRGIHLPKSTTHPSQGGSVHRILSRGYYHRASIIRKGRLANKGPQSLGKKRHSMSMATLNTTILDTRHLVYRIKAAMVQMKTRKNKKSHSYAVKTVFLRQYQSPGGTWEVWYYPAVQSSSYYIPTPVASQEAGTTFTSVFMKSHSSRSARGSKGFQSICRHRIPYEETDRERRLGCRHRTSCSLRAAKQGCKEGKREWSVTAC
ncbi:unnamed protein product [Penicillium bialowiezense]